MRPLEPLSLSRELSELSRRVERQERALSRGQGLDRDPFGSERMGKTLFDAVRALPESDPLRPELLRWVFALSEARIDLLWSVREAELEHVELHPVREPSEGSFSLAAMTRSALFGAESARWHAAREASSARLGAHRVALWERRHELAVRMGLPSFDALEPFELVATAQARPFARATQDALRELVTPGFAALVEASLGLRASSGWPARLAADTLAPLLGHADLLRGLSLDVDVLPERLAPASFARAFYALGFAFLRAQAPRGQPFVVAHDRGHLSAHAHAALFCSLVADTAFLQKQLGLSGDELARARRAYRLALLCWVRLAAARAELRQAALRGGPAVREAHAELLAELTGRELPSELTLGLFRLEVLEGPRLAGWFLAAARREELTNLHDEDWFRNPRAVEQLREEARLVPRRAASAEELERGRAAFEKWLFEGLSR